MSAAAKAALRAELAAVRRARTPADLEAARAAIRAAVLGQAALSRWRCVAAYVPLRTEPGSVELLDALTASGIRVLVPSTLDDRDLDWTAWGAEPAGAALGRDAIATAEAVLVPALAVGADGTRLGRGGGSYDRALRRVGPGVPIVAVLFAGEQRESVPREAWDVAVTIVVSPDGWRPLGNPATGLGR